MKTRYLNYNDITQVLITLIRPKTGETYQVTTPRSGRTLNEIRETWEDDPCREVIDVRVSPYSI